MRLLLTLGAVVIAGIATAPLALEVEGLRRALAPLPVMGGPLGPMVSDIAAARLAVADLPAETLGGHDPALAALMLAAPGGGLTQTLMQAEAAWPQKLGLQLAEIDSIAALGDPPQTLLRFGFAAALRPAVAAALTADGYQPGYDGVLRRGAEDYAHNLADRDPGDPLGGQLGLSSRVLLTEDALSWSSGMAALAALEGATWGGRPDLTAALEALAARPGGGLATRVQILPDQLAFTAGPDIAAVLTGAEAGDGPQGLPPWSLALIVDSVASGQAETLLALVFATRAHAEDAAARLAADWSLELPMYRQSPADLFGAPRVAIAGEGPFVLILGAPARPAGLFGGQFERLLGLVYGGAAGFLGPAVR